MFTVGDYQISFQKSYSLILSKDRGRFDTICRIERKDRGLLSDFLSKGVAYIHPKDSPDKITGKKVALTKALTNTPLSKETRTVIWKAFWEWVESWKTNESPDCFGEPTQESELCNNCSYLDHCISKLWKESNSK